MTSDTPVRTLRRKIPLVRIAAVLVILMTVTVLFVRMHNRPLLRTCESGSSAPDVALEACDDFLSGMIFPKAAEVSLIHRHRMRAYMRMGETDAALREVELAIEADPRSQVPWQWKALILARAEEYPDALRAIDSALALAPGDDYSLETKAKLFRERGKPDELREFYRQLAEDLPGRVWIFTSWGHYQLKDQEFEAAAVNFSKALHLNPKDTQSLRKFFHACRMAGGDCPPLVPETQQAAIDLSCEEAFSDVATAFPKWAERSGDADFQRFLLTTPPIQSGAYAFYVGTTRMLESSADQTSAEHYVGLQRALGCILAAQKDRPKSTLEREVEASLARVYPEPVRQNLMQWANMVLTQKVSH